MITWILVANSAEAKFFSTDNLRIGELKLLRELTHPDSRKKISDLMTDSPGHYKTDSGMRGCFSKNDPKEVEAEHFAIQLVHELKTGWDHSHYQHLIIVTPSHFYGLIKKHIHSHHADLVHIAKDYTRYPLKELTASLREHLFK